MSIVDQGALKFNHRGRLAPGQVIYLLPMLLAGAFLFLLGVSLLIVIVVFLGYAFTAQPIKGNVGVAVIGDSCIAVPFLFLTIVGIVICRKQIIDLLFGQVSQVEGVGGRSSSSGTGSRGTHYGVLWYGVGNESFQIPFRGTWNSLPKDVPVRAYYTRAVKHW